MDWEVEKSGNWVAAWGEDGDFELTHLHSSEKFIIDINKQSYSCNFWGLVGMPYRHAVAAIQFRNFKVVIIRIVVIQGIHMVFVMTIRWHQLMVWIYG